ncbi:MAG: fluoride efflux transporter CrcB [Gemmatimonadales bacterium]
MLWYVAIGSAAGGVSRYLLGGVMQRASAAFPWGTLVVNIAGSFLLGALMRYSLSAPSLSPETRALLTIGFCGGFTTFSTFSYEAIRLMQDGEWPQALGYIAASVLVSLLAVWLGMMGAEWILIKD